MGLESRCSLALGLMAKAKAPAPVFVGNDAEELGSVGPRGRGIALEQMFVRSYPRDANPPERVRFFNDDKSTCLPVEYTHVITCSALAVLLLLSFFIVPLLVSGEARGDAVRTRH